MVATSTDPSDDPIEDFSRRLAIPVFRGSPGNVLDRFHAAAQAQRCEVIVRITADDPFKDPEIIDRAIGLLLDSDADYCSNTVVPTFPDGLDVEVFTVQALDRAWRQASLPSEHEHVTPYIWKNPSQFRLVHFTHEPDLSHLRWTIDYEQDFQFAEAVCRRLQPAKGLFLMRDILELLEHEPQLAAINSRIPRNEGYTKSLLAESHS